MADFRFGTLETFRLPIRAKIPAAKSAAASGTVGKTDHFLVNLLRESLVMIHHSTAS
jgi:hypothetical protein